MEALGIIDTIDRAADLIPLDEVREPEPGAAAVYAAVQPTFAQLYDALTPAFRALRDLDRLPHPEPPSHG
jgi:gluconokinase